MSEKFKGTLYGAAAAVSYGVNPLGALFLYREGVNTFSVLFYRFFLAAIIAQGILIIQKKSLKVTKKELSILATLGVLFAVSAFTLFYSFHYMDAGVASTLLFVYPVMVAVMMALFFKEKISFVTIASISLAILGIILLYKGDGKTTLSTLGVLLVMLSSFSYAVYIIIVNKSSLMMPTLKLTFYVLLFCVLCITICSFLGGDDAKIKLLPGISAWLWAIMLAVVPTIISLITISKAIHAIGATPTAILGALEPVTAVFIGVVVFNELFTPRLGLGILLILSGVLLIVAGKSVKPTLIISSLNGTKNRLKKYFKWK